ncbi:nuclear transport factor 2 family protein [Nocardia sp. CDC153]|uniref:YybH family protein n=1 Tax=Nocardia sp. CDC153 TaxID=3112167 RepID=UPI002DB60388|nr:nuclear transport factor 2 family protein [Nocardia sp. CDC153]MEC3955149.1 nuclear transport factor 2 family protein [Nocardia sp. CDC153]
MTTITDPASLPTLFESHLNAGDIDAVLALFTPDATMRTTTGTVITGPDALRQEITGTVAANGHLTNKPRHVLVGADTALLVTDWTMDITTPEGRISPTGTTANIARRLENGEWRFTLLNPLGTA